MDHPLIERLADGRFHSGEELGEWLGISRAAVWKRLQKLERLGLYCERVRGKGYRLSGGLDLLEPGRIRASLHGVAAQMPLTLVEETVSTNTDLLEALRNGEQAPRAALAEFQSGGRGRRGRRWVSPYGSSLYLSLAWPFQGGASQLEGLSLAVGAVLAELLAEEGLARDIGLKWPNDVLARERKLAGILIELAGDVDDRCVAVIGVGVNGALGESHGALIDQQWTDLQRELGRMPDRNRLAGRLISRLVEMLPQFAAQGFSAMRKTWSDWDLCRGRPVRVLVGDRVTDGVALGVTDKGGLRVDVDGEERLFHGGEVSLRLASTDGG